MWTIASEAPIACHLWQISSYHVLPGCCMPVDLAVEGVQKWELGSNATVFCPQLTMHECFQKYSVRCGNNPYPVLGFHQKSNIQSRLNPMASSNKRNFFDTDRSSKIHTTLQQTRAMPSTLFSPSETFPVYYLPSKTSPDNINLTQRRIQFVQYGTASDKWMLCIR